MTDKYIVAHDFTHGSWSFREGEDFTPDQAEACGLDEKAIEHFRRRGNLKTPSEVAYDEAEASRQRQVAMATPPQPEDAQPPAG